MRESKAFGTNSEFYDKKEQNDDLKFFACWKNEWGEEMIFLR